jgi:hypothetical protein
MNPPTVTFGDVLKQQLAEHRRVLLERLIAEYPEILNSQRSIVESWRYRLRYHK